MPSNATLFEPAIPFHMVWLATNACTARCLHCSSNSARRAPDELTTDEAVDLIDQFVESGVIDLGVSGGEPLLRRDLLHILDHAKHRGMTVGVATNGAKLPVHVAEQLSALGLNRLQVSLDGPPACHDTLRRWPGLFDRVLKTIETARNVGIRVHVCCTINKLNASRLDEFVAFLATLDIQRLNFSRFVPTGRGTDALDLPNARWQAVIRNCASLKKAYGRRLEIVTHLAQQILVDDEVAPMPAFVGCQAGRGQGCVTANGTILPCVLLPIPLGNVRTAPFADIWQSSATVKALQDRGNLESKCGSCSLRARCGGCRAVAYARTGNLFASDPRCWLSENLPVCTLQ